MACKEQGVSVNASFTDHLSCKICLEILTEPVQCQRNEHYFCKSCLQQHLVRSQTCPLCMEELTLETLRSAPRVVAEFVSHLKTPRCDFVHRGCKEKVPIQDLSVHHEVCGFAPVICSNEGCGASVNRQEVASHENESCNFRMVKCEDCGNEVVFQVYGKHSCVIRREIDEMKTRFEAMQAMVQTHNAFIEDLQDPFRNVTTSSQIFVASDKSIEVFNWSTKTWTLHKDVLFYPRKYSFSFPYKNNIMVCGGEKHCGMEYVNIRKHPIISRTFPVSFPEKRRYPGGKGSLCGNRILTFENAEVHEVDLDSPGSSGRVLRLADYKRFYGVECINQKIYIVGGQRSVKSDKPVTKEEVVNSVLMYDPCNSCIKTLAPLPWCVSKMATVAYKDNIIILGGEDSKGMPSNRVIMYNVNSQECEKLPSMLQKRSGCAAVVIEDVIIVMGGVSRELVLERAFEWNYQDRDLGTVEYLVFGEDSWQELPPMHRTRSGATACVQL